MRVRILFVIVFIVGFGLEAWAGDALCSRRKSGVAHKTTIADPAEDQYDIKHLVFHLNMSDTSVYVAGNVSTGAVVVTPTMSRYVFELDSALTIDSAKINGAAVTVSTSGAVRSVAISAMPAGSYFTAQVFYHGTPPGGSGFFNGITHAVTSGGTHVVYTVSDPYVARNWWPSKQSILDKIDTVDMYVTVPRGVVDGSNGVLLNVDSTSVSGFWTYHWQTHYPIDYYLISVAIARYTQDKFYAHFSGSTDSVLIQNFFMDTATFYPASKRNFDSLGQFIDYFSTLYGRYPFWKEKYGVCYSTLTGGMEHQTMTTIGVPSTYIIAHELCHQWFGDNVTYRTWGDVWLSEGFATFSEQLYMAQFRGAAAALAHRSSYLTGLILNDPCGKLYVDDTTTSDSLFNGATVYAKGQAVVRMLQYLAPSDSAFFRVLRIFQTTYALGNASTADLKAIAETIYGTNLDTFFNQWVYGRGFPIYTITWNQSGANVFVKIVQKTSCPSSTPRFSTPIELQLHGASADTFIRVYNDRDTTIYQFTWDQTMTRLYLNPNVWTICKANGISKDGSLGFNDPLPRFDIKVFPNPTKNYWEAGDLPEGSRMVLEDMNGKALWGGTATKGNNIIPGQRLPAGNYLLKVQDAAQSKTIVLTHW